MREALGGNGEDLLQGRVSPVCFGSAGTAADRFFAASGLFYHWIGHF